MKFGKVYLGALCSFGFVFGCYASSASSLDALEKAMEKSSIAYQILTNKFEKKQIELKNAEQSADFALNKYAQSREKLQELLKIDDKNPGSINGPLAAGRKERDDNYAVLKESKNALSDNKEQLSRLSIELEAANQDYENSVKQYIEKANQVIDSKLSEKIKNYEEVREVTVEGTHNCGDDETRRQCREKAQQDAERKAIEQGSSIFINSVTEMKNFKIQKDVIERKVNASIVSSTELKSWHSYSGQGENETETYFYKMKANVKPNFPSEIRKDLRYAIQLQLAGKYSQLLDSDKKDKEQKIVAQKNHEKEKLLATKPKENHFAIEWKGDGKSYWLYVDGKDISSNGGTISELIGHDLFVNQLSTGKYYLLEDYTYRIDDKLRPAKNINFLWRGKSGAFWKGESDLYWLYVDGKLISGDSSVTSEFLDNDLLVHDLKSEDYYLLKDFKHNLDEKMRPAKLVKNLWRSNGESYWVYVNGKLISGDVTNKLLGNDLFVHDGKTDKYYLLEDYKHKSDNKIRPAKLITNVWRSDGQSYWLYVDGKQVSGDVTSEWRNDDLVVHDVNTDSYYLFKDYKHKGDNQFYPAQNYYKS